MTRLINSRPLVDLTNPNDAKDSGAQLSMPTRARLTVALTGQILPTMDQPHQHTETQLPDSLPPSDSDSEAADPTRICWTQWLRANPQDVDAQLPPLQQSPNTFPIEKLFS